MRKNNKFFPSTFINSKVITTISMSLVLVLLGLVVFLSLFANDLSNFIKENLSFDIVLQDNTNKKEIQCIQNSLEKSPFTKKVNYVPKEKAIKKLSIELGENPEEFLGFNPLPDIIVIHLKWQYANPDSLKFIKTYLKKISNSNIKTVEYREKILKTVTNNITKISFVLLNIACGLLFISFALISNTVRLTVYSRRFLIRTMQLVGAKKGFICKPFIISNIIVGIIASVIACGLLYWLIDYTRNNVLNTNELLNSNSLSLTFGSVFVFGTLISSIATYFSVSKYISADINELYKT